MDWRLMGIDSQLMTTLEQMLEISDETEKPTFHAPSRAYVRDNKAMASTPADVKEDQNSIVYITDMPGIRPEDIKVQVEEGNVLTVSGERRRDKEKEKEGMKYVKMERRMGKFMRKFNLPDNANLDTISAVSRDGVLTVTVEKKPPPEAKKPVSVEVKIAQ